MTRRGRLATIAFLGACVTAPPAHALFGVGDVVFDPTVFAETVATVEQLANQLAVLQQQYNQLVQTYQAVAHLPDATLQALAAQLNIPQLRSPITTDPAAIVSSIAGFGAVGAAAQQFLRQNGVYVAPGRDFLATQLSLRGNSVAAVQGMVNELYASATQHAQALQALEGQLAGAPDSKTIQDVAARIQIEQAHLQARQIQAQTLVAFQGAQQRNEDTQRDQLRRCQYDEVIAAGRSQTPLGSTSCERGAAAPGASAVSGGSGSGGDASIVPASLGGSATDAMAAQPWGQQASQYAQQMGVNPTVLAGVCQIESNCRNVAGSGTISGPFQMSDGTYNQSLQQAIAQNPSLAGVVGGKTDPATESIAASQYLRNAATSLQAGGIANPTGLDVRAYYNFGPSAGLNVANAPDGSNMAGLLPSGTNLAANGITPEMTVGQWRQMVTSRMGTVAANAPVLLARNGA